MTIDRASSIRSSSPKDNDSNSVVVEKVTTNHPHRRIQKILYEIESKVAKLNTNNDYVETQHRRKRLLLSAWRRYLVIEFHHSKQQQEQPTQNNDNEYLAVQLILFLSRVPQQQHQQQEDNDDHHARSRQPQEQQQEEDAATRQTSSSSSSPNTDNNNERSDRLDDSIGSHAILRHSTTTTEFEKDDDMKSLAAQIIVDICGPIPSFQAVMSILQRKHHTTTTATTTLPILSSTNVQPPPPNSRHYASNNSSRVEDRRNNNNNPPPLEEEPHYLCDNVSCLYLVLHVLHLILFGDNSNNNPRDVSDESSCCPCHKNIDDDATTTAANNNVSFSSRHSVAATIWDAIAASSLLFPTTTQTTTTESNDQQQHSNNHSWIVPNVLAIPGLIHMLHDDYTLRQHRSPTPHQDYDADDNWIIPLSSNPLWSAWPITRWICCPNNDHEYYQNLVCTIAARMITMSESWIIPPPSRSSSSSLDDTSTTSPSLLVDIWVQLVMSLLRRKGGDMDIAIGLYQACMSSAPSTTSTTRQRDNNSNNAGTTTSSDGIRIGKHDNSSNNEAWERVIHCTVSRCSSREVALLCRASLRQYAAVVMQRPNRRRRIEEEREKQSDNDDNPRDTATVNRTWLQTMCGIALQYHGSDVCRLVVLSSSSVRTSKVTQNNIDRTLCQTFVIALQQQQLAIFSDVPGKHGDEEGRSPESDSESDDDDDDEFDHAALSRTELEFVPPSDRCLYHYLCTVADTWATQSFVRHTPASLQHHATGFLVFGLQQLQSLQSISSPSDGDNNILCLESSSLIMRLMEGVTARLGVANAMDIRNDGMKIAESIATKLGQSLLFDELSDADRHDDRFYEVLSSSVSEVKSTEVVAPNPSENDASNAAPSMSSTIVKSKKRTMRRKVQNWDPDAIYESSDSGSVGDDNDTDNSSSDDDSEWDDEDGGLKPYDLDDDMDDLRITPRPLYLSECLDYLRTAENEEHIVSRHETVLQELPKLVQSRPADLYDLGPTLAFSVLRLENKYNIPDFRDMVLESLCALTVEDPMAVGTHLIGLMFQEGTFYDRLMVLRALENSALVLSGRDDSDSALAEASYLPEQIEDRVSGKRALISSAGAAILVDDISISGPMKQNDARTQRWGKGRLNREKWPKTIQNRFGSVAPVWFYALVGQFLDRRSDAALWGEETGAALLSCVFISLTRFIWCSGPNAPGIDILAKDLFELVWSFRTAEIAAVRNAVLGAVSVVLGCLRTDAALALLLDSTSQESLVRNVQLMSEYDPDEKCRDVAMALTQTMISTLDALRQPRFLA